MALKSDVVNNGDQVASATSIDGGNWADISEKILLKFIDVLEAALVLVIIYFLIRHLKKYFAKIEATHENQRTALNLLEKITVGFTIIVGITIALKIVGLDITMLVSVGLLGLSYGLKDVIKNYIAGILIFLKSPFKIGDIVRIKRYVGKVQTMEFQATTLKTFDNRDITIYNSDIMIQSIENYSRYPMRRMELNVKLGYGSDTDKALKIFNKIFENNSSILKSPKYSIVFRNFSDNSVIVQLKFWVPMPSNMLAIRSNLAWQIYKAFNEEGIYMPYTKDIQIETDYTLTEARKKTNQEFAANPMFADTGVATAPTGQPTAEFVDADEPMADDDFYINDNL